MRVCLDCTPFLVRSAGVKSYLFYLDRYLRATAEGREVCNFPFLAQPAGLRHDVPALGRLGSLARAAFATRLHRPWNPVSKWATRRADVFHASNLVRYAPSGVALTTTVHDLTSLLMPELHTPQTIAADRAFITQIVTPARRVIAVSNRTKQDLLANVRIPEEKISVIYSGVREEYFLGDPADGASVRARHGLTRPYVLFVGTLEPRKNLGRLLDAYSIMRPSVRAEFDLALVGMPGWLNKEEKARVLRQTAGVRRLGYVAEEDIPAILAGATVFAFPSLYEGFGFPVVEALAAGVPVLTSNVASLPEVGGEAACYVDPLSVDEITTALERLLTSPAERSAMSERGRVQACKFSWTECARQTWAVFEEAAGG